MKSAAALTSPRGAVSLSMTLLRLLLLVLWCGFEPECSCRGGVESPLVSALPSAASGNPLVAGGGGAVSSTNNFRAVGSATVGGRSGAERDAGTRSPKPPWKRIVLVGASASAGFTESEPFGGPNTRQYQLSRYIDAAVAAPHEAVRNFASSLFFLQPEAEGRRQVAQAVESKPTLVVGLDFLFWFCYGDGASDAARLKRFEQGLKLLESVPCSLIVGDIPDASAAIDTALSPEQVPSAQAIAAANRRLKDWAATRRAVVLPLSRFMRSAMANQALTVHGRTFARGQTRSLLQADKLHPSALGCAVLAVSLLDAFVATQPALPAADVRWDPEGVLRLGSRASPGNRPAQIAPALPAGKAGHGPKT